MKLFWRILHLFIGHDWPDEWEIEKKSIGRYYHETWEVRYCYCGAKQRRRV